MDGFLHKGIAICPYYTMLKLGACHNTLAIQIHSEPVTNLTLGGMNNCKKYLHDLSQSCTDFMVLNLMSVIMTACMDISIFNS